VALNPGAPASIPALIAARVAAHGAETVLRKKDRGIWQAMTWAELGARVRDVGMGLQAVGFRPGDVGCVLAETRPEWVFVDLGILGAGGVSGGIGPAEEPDALESALRAAECRVLFVENDEQLDKVLLVRERCPALQRIVIFDMKGLRDFSDPLCESFAVFTARGRDTNAEPAIAAIAADRPAILLLPHDGATGKGRTLTHGDALHLVASAQALLGVRAGEERLALLPMCHAMERILGLYLALDARVVSNYL
jgi:long-chain acyl-CoA synthetase